MSIRCAWLLAAVALAPGWSACPEPAFKGSVPDDREQPGQDIALDSGGGVDAGVDVGVDAGADLFAPPPDAPPVDAPLLCIPEGEGIEDPNEPQCCPGLTMISKAEYNPATELCVPLDGSAVCADCGNGQCEAWETPCTCDEDCEFAPPCVPAGGLVEPSSGLCCPELSEIQSAAYDPITGECDYGGGMMVCSDCGGGACETLWENYCNCPKDCDAGDACTVNGGTCTPVLEGGSCPDGAAAQPLSGCAEEQLCCVPDAECLPAGGMTGVFPDAPDCCADLLEIATAEYDPGTGQCEPLEGGVVCTPCGNGVCDSEWETPCTCPQDCSAAPCVGEGQPAGTKDCCPGLTTIEATVYSADVGGCVSSPSSPICADCGNAACEYLWENPCNCSVDCDPTMLCTENGGSCLFPPPDFDVPGCPDGTIQAWFGGCDLGQLCCFDEPDCVEEGGTVPIFPGAPLCCGSSAPIIIASYDSSAGVCNTETGTGVCAECGNASCESGWENFCNCPEDCGP